MTVGLRHVLVGRHDGLTIATLREEERKVGLPLKAIEVGGTIDEQRGIGKSNGLFHRLWRPPCRPRSATGSAPAHWRGPGQHRQTAVGPAGCGWVLGSRRRRGTPSTAKA
jgi:hypothetical protein